MKIYIVQFTHNRIDDEAFPFSTAEKAIEYAKRLAKHFCHDESLIREESFEGFVYTCEYKLEQYITVVEKVLDKPEKAAYNTLLNWLEEE